MEESEKLNIDDIDNMDVNLITKKMLEDNQQVFIDYFNDLVVLPDELTKKREVFEFILENDIQIELIEYFDNTLFTKDLLEKYSSKFIDFFKKIG